MRTNTLGRPGLFTSASAQAYCWWGFGRSSRSLTTMASLQWGASPGSALSAFDDLRRRPGDGVGMTLEDSMSSGCSPLRATVRENARGRGPGVEVGASSPRAMRRKSRMANTSALNRAAPLPSVRKQSRGIDSRDSFGYRKHSRDRGLRLS